MKTKTFQEINALLQKELNHKVTVQEMEQHARSVMNSLEMDFKNYPKLYKQAEKQIEFYKGVLRAIELLRKHGLLSEGSFAKESSKEKQKQ